MTSPRNSSCLGEGAREPTETEEASQATAGYSAWGSQAQPCECHTCLRVPSLGCPFIPHAI